MTKPFSSDLIYSDKSTEFGRFMLLIMKDIVYEGSQKIVVPAGFMSDCCSIPRIFQIFISKVGPYNGAGIVHDWGYCSQYLTRKEVDGLFLEIMEKSGVGFFTRYSMYLAMRLVGGIAWSICKSDVDLYRELTK